MKIKYLFLAAILTIALSLPLFGQDKPADIIKSDTKNNDMSTMMGKPTAEATVDGLHMQVWIVTEEAHQKMMKEMGISQMIDTSTMLTRAAAEPMMEGTHHIMLVIKDIANDNKIDSATALVLFVSPSNKNASVDLKSMMNHFGGSLILNEKGEYALKVSVKVAGVYKSTQFKYLVN